MKKTYLTLPTAGLLVAVLAVSSASGAKLIIGDDYNVPGNGTGFALDTGVNSGINPPVTRLTGTAAAGLVYVKTAGTKSDGAHSISDGKLTVAREASNSSTLSLSSGTGAYDYGAALNTLALSPATPAVYELSITISNAAAGTQRCSFALSSATGTAGAWDFGIQIYHASGDTAYTLQRRISANACGGAAVNQAIGPVGTYPNEVTFLIRVTDAGSESDTYSSRVQVSVDGGATWVYDTSTDTGFLPNGFRFASSSRFIYWDVAGGAGPVGYDDFALNWISGPTAGTRTWTGGGADNNWSTAANWGGTAPATGDTLIFNGTTRQSNNNDIEGLAVPWVTFNNGGFTLSGNTWTNTGAITNLAGNNTLSGDLAWDSTSAKIWSIAAGSELHLANTTTVEVNGDQSIVGGGTLRQTGAMNIGQIGTANPAFVINEGTHAVDGGSFTSRGGYRIGSLATAASGAQTIISNGGVFTLTVSGANLRVGDSANPVTARLVVDHSTVSMAGGALAVPYAAGATAVVSQVGGSVSGCRLSFSDSGAGQGTYTLQDGALAVLQIRNNTAGGVAAISFDNAVLTALFGADNAFMSGLNSAEIKAGGLTFDAQGDVVVAQDLTGAGALIKSNYAVLTLTGVNTYAGNTIVQGGKLVLPTGRTYTTSVQVADYAELGVLVQSEGTTLTNGAVSLGNSTLSFDLATFSTPTAPLMKVASLSANGVVTINVANGLQLKTGQIVLVDYDGTIGGGGFNAFQLANLPPGVAANLVNNTANSSIDMNITSVPGFLWTGAVNGDWDYGTLNWLDRRNGLPSAYSDGFPLEFFDGATNRVINLLAYPMPTAITVSNNALPYFWNGGAITTPMLKKFGTNSLTRIGGEADAINTLELNEGTYVFSNLYDATFSTVLTDTSGGAGTFDKEGPGTLTVPAANSGYNGSFVIEEGIVKIGANRALGSTSATIVVTNGGTFDINNLAPGAQPVIVSGAGVGGQGAIIDSTTATGVSTSLRDVRMAGDTTLGSPNGGRWDIRVRLSTGPGPGLQGNGHNLTKVGPGFVSIACQRNLEADTPYWRMDLGDVNIKEGTLVFAESLDLGNPSAALSVWPGAILQLYDLGLTNPLWRTITMTNAQLNASGSAAHTNVLNGGIVLTGPNDIFIDSAHLIINSAVTGSGSIAVHVNEPGTLLLNGINNYSGDTVVTNGTIGGTGVIAGNLIMLGGTNAPGEDAVGTLTVNGNVTLAGTTVMELDRSLSPNSDRLVVGGALTFGGVLQVVLGSGAPPPQAGDVYQLFSKGSATAFTQILLPDLSGLPGGLGWDTTKLGVDGTIAVTGKSSPVIGTVSLSGSNFTFSGTGGIEGDTYYVLSSTNAAEPLSAWMPVVTNVFGPGGTFTYSTDIAGGGPRAFFTLAVP